MRMVAHGVNSATAFETTGPLGLMAGETLPAALRDFPGTDYRLEGGWVFPLYHLFADWAEFLGGEAWPLRPPQPLGFAGLFLRKGNRHSLLAANLGNAAATLAFPGLSAQPAGVPYKLRRLNERNAMAAMRHPETYRTGWEGFTLPYDGSLDLAFAAQEYVRLDWTN
jgi:hypothetical protein